MHFLAAVLLFSVFVNLLMLTDPLLMLQIYDRVLGTGSEATLVALFLLVGCLYLLMAQFGARFQDSLDSRVFGAVVASGAYGDPRRSTGRPHRIACESNQAKEEQTGNDR